MNDRADQVKATLFDSHAHLTFRDFGEDLDEVLERAREAGLVGIITIGSGGGPRVFEEARELARAQDEMWATVGLHPHDARHGSPELYSEFRESAASPEVVAIGEAGLDYHYNYSPRAEQLDAFRIQLEMARELRLPIVIHTREADDDTLSLIKEVGLGEAGGVVHCFSGDASFAESVLDLGLHVSFSGIVTFPKAESVRDAARLVPDSRLLIETDSPFLAPPPKRGRRNEPALVRQVAKTLAEVRGLSLEDVGRITTQNTRRLFALEANDRAPVVYAIRDQLYVNATNRCTLSCVFCPKRKDWTVKGYVLRHGTEPPDDELEQALERARPERYREVVFCGLGEPTMRYACIVKLGKSLRARGIKTRLDTDGLASLREGRDVTTELCEAFDAVSVSLNAADGETYSRLCPSKFGTEAWSAAVDFLKKSRGNIAEVTASVVAVPDLDVESVRRMVEEDIGVSFRVREYNVVG